MLRFVHVTCNTLWLCVWNVVLCACYLEHFVVMCVECCALCVLLVTLCGFVCGMLRFVRVTCNTLWLCVWNAVLLLLVVVVVVVVVPLLLLLKWVEA